MNSSEFFDGSMVRHLPIKETAILAEVSGRGSALRMLPFSEAEGRNLVKFSRPEIILKILAANCRGLALTR
jgi:hypothetical protein